MMKRGRAVDGRQFRRAAKKPRFAENVYFNPSTFTYLKLFFIWLVCISLDLLIGVRLELGWPILLFFRQYSEVVSSPNGSLRFYSTFSIFYLFLTLTSDLICYLFLPVQLMLFFASTYVWLQVAYQWNFFTVSPERGLCPRVVVFWILFASFEYFFRFRILMPHWYNSRSVWVTASMFPTVTDSFVANQASSHRLALYRVLSSHALGFPLVTLGFKLKQSATNWSYERQRNDVQKNNEVFDRILAEAIPSVYEGKKRHEVNSRHHHLAIEGDALDFELDPTGADLDEPRLYVSSNGPVPSIFDKNVHNTVNASPAPSRSSNGGTEAPAAPSGGNVPYNRKTSRHSKVPMKQQNGSSHNGAPPKSGKKNGGPSANGNRNGSAVTHSAANANSLEEDAGDDDHLPMRTPTVISLIAWLFKTVYNALASLTSASSASLRASGSDANADDRPSSVSSGSGGGDELDSDGESVATSNLDAPSNGLPATVKSGTNGTANTVHTNTSQVTTTATSVSGTAPSTAPTQSTGGGKKKGKSKQNQGGRGRALTSDFNFGDAEYEVAQPNGGFMRNRRGGPRMESPEDELNRLRNEAKGAKLIESELRERINSMHQFERTAKNETQQFKLRCEQLDSKYKAQVKQNEQSKAVIASLEKRLNDAQVRKDAMERELMLERVTKSNGDSSTDDLLAMRQKIVKLEAELRKTRAETKAKEEFAKTLEEKLHELQVQRSSVQKIADDGSRKISDVQHENSQLRKALSEENRVKQDLFKALKTSKAQIDTLQARLRSLGCNGGLDDATADPTAAGFGLADLRSSPTTIPSTPAATSRAPENFEQLFSMTGTSYMPYTYGNTMSMTNLRLSPEENRDSPPIGSAEPTSSSVSPRPVASPQSLTP